MSVVFKLFFFDNSENLKNLTVRSGKQRALLPDTREDRHEEKMDTTEDEKQLTHPTSQSKYIKQAKNATSKANAEKMALNAIREKMELEKLREEQSEKYTEETSRKERTRTPAGKSAATRKSQKSASNRNSYITDSVNYDNDIQYGKPYVDVSNRQVNTQYNTTFPDFRSGNLVEGNKQSSPEMKIDMTDNRNEVFDNEIDMDETPSESKYIKRKHSSKVVQDNKQKTKSKSPEPIVLTPRDPPHTTRTNTYTVNLEAPNNQELDNSHKSSDSPPERKKVENILERLNQ